jgi:chlorobactene glucosyltransferase
MILWISITALTAIVWLIRHVQISIAARILPPLNSRQYLDAAAKKLPAVSFLVAGKEEEANIRACLMSMLALEYPSLQIISINDRSNDSTGQIMDEIAAGNPRLTALHVRELPAGWLGKNNAMRTGVEQATGEWLCFTDADCVMTSPRTLQVAMCYAMEKRADFLSVLPAHDTQGFWERVIQPACSGIMMLWFNPLRVNNPRRKTAYANGAFMLMRRSCYNTIGRHEAVKTEFNEDMRMAQLAKAAGLHLHVVSSNDLYTVRMYQSVREMWNGWSRIFFGCFVTLRRLVTTLVLIALFSLVPWFTLAASAAVVFLTRDAQTSGHQSWLLLFYSAIAACLAQFSVMCRFYRLNHTHAAYAALYPLGVTVGLGALINAIRRLRKRSTITWRGTTYTANVAAPQLAAHAAPSQVH